MQMYKILGADGEEYGPVNADLLQEWIAQKRADATTLVQAEGASDWKPLSAFPEFAAALAAGPAVPLSGGSVPATPPPSGPVQTSQLAILSLICGILGCFCLPALAGLVLGLISLSKIRKSNGRLRGRGLAIAGICLSIITLLAFLLSLQPGHKHGPVQRRFWCVAQLREVCRAARMYSEENAGAFPPDFASMSNVLSTPRLLLCPSDTKHTAASNWAAFDPLKNLSYEYLKPGIAESNAANEVIFRCPIHNNVALGDGSVQMRSGR